MSDDATDLSAAAHKALERYRTEARDLETQLAYVRTRLEMVHEFISQLTDVPRTRRKRTAVEAPAGADAPLAPGDLGEMRVEEAA